MAFCDRKLLLFLVTPFIFLFMPAYGQLTARPHNTFTLIREKTVLACCSLDQNAVFKWIKYLEHGRAQRICSRGDDCQLDPNYVIDKSTPGCSNLTIVSPSAHDSTYFECSIDGTDDKAAAYVIPYNCHADNNNQNDFVEGDIVTFRCEVLCKDKLQFSSYWMNEHGKILKWNNFTGESCVSTWIVSLQKPVLKAYTWFLQFLMDPNVDEQFDKTNASITWTSKKEQVDYPLTNIRESFHNPNPDYISSTLSQILIYLQVILAAVVVVIAIAVLPSCLSNMHCLITKAKQLYDSFWKDSQQSASSEEREPCLDNTYQLVKIACNDGVPDEQRQPHDDGLEEHREVNGNCVQKIGGAHPEQDDDKTSTIVDMPASEVADE